jgi:cystathionine beta-lyase
MTEEGDGRMRDETKIVHSGRDPERFDGVVNPPVLHASTILARNLADWEERRRRRAQDLPGTYYGLLGTATTRSLEQALADLEGAYRAIVYPSGLAACVVPILAFVAAGDHVLVTDSVYGPTRRFAEQTLGRLGVETTFYDPLAGRGIEALLRPRTRVVFVESPGSLTFEVQDVPAIAEVAHRHGAVVIMDNTWGTPLHFRALAHGVDVSVQAVTKYVGGHSDLILGAAAATEAAWPALQRITYELGQCAGPDDVYLAQRGLRTMHVRLKRHWETGLMLAEWLARQREVERVLHPGLPGDPGHALWKRDFTGGCGLFGAVLKPIGRRALEAFFDGFRLFGIGASWGGYESLIVPVDLAGLRTATRWPHPGPAIRIHAGLEAPEDLVTDLEAAFARLRAAAG